MRYQATTADKRLTRESLAERERDIIKTSELWNFNEKIPSNLKKETYCEKQNASHDRQALVNRPI